MKLKEIGERIRTQDNRCTSDPIFIVQEKKRIYGAKFSDQYVWCDTLSDWDEADEEKARELDQKDILDDTGTWEKVFYLEIWEFVTACFTEQGCKDYLAANGHNLSDETRIYAASAYRNEEFIAVREFLKTA